MSTQFMILSAALALVGCGGGMPVVPDSGAEVIDAGTLTVVDAGPTVVDAGPVDAGPVDAGPAGLPILGNFKHDLGSIEFTLVANAADGLNAPRDVAINPASPTDVWIVNYADDSMVIVRGFGTATPVKGKYSGNGSIHFMPRPSALAFGQANRMATIHEEDRPTQGVGSPGDFMGPSLWITDNTFEGGHVSHYDMLHNSPNSVGIAWDKANIYWVFDGFHNAITRYDFVMDHGPGGNDHTDGIISRCVEGQVSYVKGITSGLELDQTSRLLYIADSGNRRIAVLNTASLSTSTMSPISPNYDGATMNLMGGMMLSTFANSFNSPLRRPSGLALHAGMVFVSDNETSQILAFDLSGQLVDWLDLSVIVPAGGLMGIDFDPAGNLYAVDNKSNRVMMISVKK